MAEEMTNFTVPDIEVRITAPSGGVYERVEAQIRRLQREGKPYILTVVFDGSNHRIYEGKQQAFVTG